MKEAGVPWIVRKLAAKYVKQSVDVIRQHGDTIKISTVNAKTSWTRTLREGQKVHLVGFACQTRPMFALTVHSTCNMYSTQSIDAFQVPCCMAYRTCHPDEARKLNADTVYCADYSHM